MSRKEGVETAATRFGPMVKHVAALLDSLRSTMPEQVATADTARNAAWAAARYSDRVAAWDAAGDAAWALVARDTVRDAAWALVVRDLIGQYGYTREHYDILTGPLRRAGITVHPDDPPLDRADP